VLARGSLPIHFLGNLASSFSCPFFLVLPAKPGLDNCIEGKAIVPYLESSVRAFRIGG
jgi:hypothetical protein